MSWSQVFRSASFETAPTHDTSTDSSSRWLQRYLRDHYVASHAGLSLFTRSAQSQRDPRVRADLRELTAQVAEDQAVLRGILDDLGVARSPWQERLARAAEHVGRLKPNGTLIRRSPLSDLLELEALAAAVHAKRLGWVCLREVAVHEPRLNPYQLELLAHRAQNQYDQLEALRLACATTVLVPPARP
jgi:hypothetical protein